MLITLLATIIVLGVLIFVHELGHFLTAKLVDIEVPRFSIGLGPKLWGFRRGETEYVISWLPLGGYVRMAGMDDLEAIEGGKLERSEVGEAAATTDAGLVGEVPRPPTGREFDSKSLPARALVISAGVTMNVIFAILAFTLIAFIWGVEPERDARIAHVAEARLPEGAQALAEVPAGARVVSVGDRTVDDWMELRTALLMAKPGPVTITFQGSDPVTIELPADEEERGQLVSALEPEIDPIIGLVTAGSPAERAGLQPGDRIEAADGQPVRSWRALVSIIETKADQPVQLTVARDATVVTTTVTPVSERVQEEDGRIREVGRIGIGVAVPRVDVGPIDAVRHGLSETWTWVAMTVGFVVDLVTGDVSPRSVGGPILIGQFSGRVARAGMEMFLRFMAIFSINLAVLNLLPIPVLDGGQLVFLGVEAVRGRALSLEQRMRFTQVGIVIVVAIMVWAIANDVLRLFGL